MNYTHLLHSAKSAFAATLVFAVLGLASYFTLEPVVSRSAVEIFEITQSITGELSFYASTTDVTMSPSIPGLTGGTADGAAVAVVTTNNPAGYNMTLEFDSAVAMQGDSEGGAINNYTPATPGTPDYTFAIGGAGTPGEFAYSVTASNTDDVDPTFRSNTGTCGSGSDNIAGTCWYATTTATNAETIVNRSTETDSSGATTTIFFRVSVPANPSPALPVDTYTATATLTAVTN